MPFTEQDKLTVYLKEYDALRAEITARTNSYTQVFTIAGAIATALFVIVPKTDFNSPTNEIFSFFGLMVTIEVLIFLGALAVVSRIWSGTKKIGKYVSTLEDRINALVGTDIRYEKFNSK